MSEGSFQHDWTFPVIPILGNYCETQMQIQVIILDRDGCLTAVPGTCVDKSFSLNTRKWGRVYHEEARRIDALVLISKSSLRRIMIDAVDRPYVHLGNYGMSGSNHLEI